LTTDTEVVIVGAGPAGSALATMLGEGGTDVALLDSSLFPRDKACGEGLMPAGTAVLERLGIALDPYPALGGVTYRVPRGGSARGDFMDGKTGCCARRLAFDTVMAERAAATSHVHASFGCDALGLEARAGGWRVNTAAGDITTRLVVGADGLHSQVARWMGWARAPRRPYRYALVSHAAARGHGIDRVFVTVLDGCEVYTAPTSPDELLVAVLGSKSGLRREDESARDAYSRHVAEAHPELSVAGSEVRGAGPFWVRPSAVAGRGVFLIGDAGGFLDPLTGDGMSDALVAASRLAGILNARGANAEAAYLSWEAGQWRRRTFVSRLALLLTGSSVLARRALRRLQRRPVTLNRLLEVNDGSRSLWTLSVRDWAALAGV
jgi:flavin-dependent dehydrogenase